MDVNAYLERLTYDGSTAADADTLIALQRAHMFTVPFENLDIRVGRPLSLELPALYDKIVTRRRGGFCYELNGLFAWLLRELGFEVTMCAASVYHEATMEWGPERDHALLIIRLDEDWAADVGFGDSFATPFPFNATEHVEGDRAYRMTPYTEGEFQLQQKTATEWIPLYVFRRTPHELADFVEMCEYQQTSPKSSFVNRSICSRATSNGRVSLANEWFIETRAGSKERRAIADEDEYRNLLRSVFGIEWTESVAPFMASTP